jgi:hypothetical protein
MSSPTATFKIVLTDGDSFVVPVTPKVIVAAERNFGCSVAKIFGDEGSMEKTYWVAWKATHFSGRVVEPFDEWLDKLASVEAGEGEAISPLEEA